MGLLGSVTASTVGWDLVLLTLFGALGYLYAQRTRRRIGTTPWRLPAVIWAIISAILPIYGLLLEMLAGLTTRVSRQRLPGMQNRPGFDQRLQQGAWQSPYSTNPYQPYGGPQANPAGGNELWPSEQSLRPGPGGWLPSASDEPAPLFGWYPDPEGVHEERYWDGRSWTETVRDAGVTSTAPLGPVQPPWASRSNQPAS